MSIRGFKIGDICRYGRIVDGEQLITDINKYQITKIQKGKYYFRNINGSGVEFSYIFSEMREFWTVQHTIKKYIKKTSWK